MSSTSVLIAGAGPTGLILALTLLRNGVSVRIIDKQEKFQIGTRGCGMQPRTIEMYKLLGILPDLLEVKADPVPVKKFPSPQGTDQGKDLPMVEQIEGTPSRPINTGFMVMQELQEHVLRSRLSKDYGCEVELSTTLTSFKEHDDHIIAIISKLDNGNLKEETVRVNWLIGADGGRSTVRKQLGIEFVGESVAEFGMVVGDIIAENGVLDQKVWRIWGDTADKMLSIRPCCVPGINRFNFFVGGANTDLEKTVASRDNVVAAINEISGRDDLKFGEVITMNVWRPNIRMVKNFGRGRVYLVGDACHVHSPTGGQGMNSGAQDAVNLGWKLSLVEKKLSPLSILESYTEERVPVIATMLEKTTELFKKTFKPETPEKMAEGWKRGYELRHFGVNYRKSPIVVDERYPEQELVDPYRSGDDGTIRAGDRAPDAPRLRVESSGTTTMLDIFRASHHTALVFADPSRHPAESILETIHVLPNSKEVVKTVLVLPQSSLATRSPAADVVLVDTEGFAYKHYAVEEDSATPTVVIVRPDGFIGCVVKGVDGVKKYFETILL
ncbi:FAD binding domain-containing protein [Rhodocollybia butyracea]|uniref:FAD binding domain-containing protein n=1 Tax=Rhodocollybia butyracea TaxID=206335 RepID=A0A9P5Q0I1_9AGAR|nr:FAD binding domain-containing protein [Rhodocollybia butyracea]